MLGEVDDDRAVRVCPARLVPQPRGSDRRAVLAAGGERRDDVVGARGITTPSGGWR